MRIYLGLLALLISFGSYAGSRIESVQMPAWLERDNTQTALRPGTELLAGDIIHTGENARVYLLLEEGSRVKIGELAEFVIENTDQDVPEESLFSAVYRVVKGAFRFTTDTLFKQRQRNININIGTVTAGIRGTDLWGKSATDKDLVCLLEGKIQVEHALAPPVILDQPLSFLSANTNMPPDPVSMITEEKLAVWSKTTELSPGAGTVTINGHYGVNLLSVTSRAAATRASQEFNRLGYASDVIEIEIRGVTWHRVAIKGFDTLADARYFADSINGKYGARSAWVSQYF